MTFHSRHLKILFTAALAYFLVDGFLNREISHPPGILVAEEPKQSDLPTSTQAIKFGEDVLQPLAKYSVKARVLSKERYRMDWGAKYSPWDLAVGWREMSDSKVLDELEISQMGRWFYIRWRQQPVSTETMMKNSSNMHIIPANRAVKSILDGVRVGSIVQMTGYLVRVDARDGGEWRSSTTRGDQFSGACEVMYVEGIDVR